MNFYKIKRTAPFPDDDSTHTESLKSVESKAVSFLNDGELVPDELLKSNL